MALTLTFGTTDAWAKANAPSPAASSPPIVEPTAVTRARVEEALPFPVDDDLVEYAQREAKTLGLDDFRGGDVVIIGSTGLIIVLLVIIIIVLL